MLSLPVTAVAAIEQVVPAGSTDSDGVPLAPGDSLANSGTITNASGFVPVFVTPGPGNIGSINNSASGIILGVGNAAIGIDGDVVSITNNGVITGETFLATVGASGRVGTFRNAGTITNSNAAGSAVGDLGGFGTFTNENTLTAAGGGLYSEGDVSLFQNSGTIEAGDGSGVLFVGNGAVGDFTNSGVITSELQGAVSIDGTVDSFTNSGTLQGKRWQAVRFDKNVGSFVNEAGGVIQNLDGLGVAGSSVGVEFNGDVESFINHGTIEGDPNSNSQDGSVGVAFFSGPVTVGSFLNTGEIFGASKGVEVHGGIGSFDNSGTITALTGAAVDIDELTDSFTNSGTISGARYNAIFLGHGVGSFRNESSGVITNTDPFGESGTGVSFHVGTTNGGKVESFFNAGEISGAPEGWGPGVVFFDGGDPNSFAVGSFTNTGQITGGGDGIWFDNGVETFTNSGSITGTDWSGVASGGDVGTFENSGTISGFDATGVGLFNGAMVGTFNNSGTIVSALRRGVEFNGHVTEFSNSGDTTGYENGVTFGEGVDLATNSGTILSTADSGQIGIRVNGSGGTIVNRGTISGADGIDFFPNNQSDPFVPGIVENSGTIEGTAGGAIQFDGANDLLKISTGSRILGDVGFGGGDDNFDFSSFSGTTVLNVDDLETVTPGDKLYVWNTASGDITIVDATAPSAMATSTAGLTAQLTNIVNGQLAGALVSPLPSDVSNYVAAPAMSEVQLATEAAVDDGLHNKAWATLFGGGSHDDAPDDFTNLYGGIVAGSHAELGEGARLGAFGGASRSQVTAASGLTLNTSSGFVGIYGQSDLGMIELDYSLVAGINGHDSSREVIALGTPETASASFTSYFFAPTLGVQLPVLSTDHGQLNVKGQVAYTGGVVQGYSETSPSLTVAWGSQNIGVLDARLELNGETVVSTNEHGTTTLSGKGGVFVQSNVGGSSVPVTFAGQTQTLAAPGSTGYGVYAGMGFSAPVSGNVALTASADASVRNDGLLSGAGSIGISGNY